MKLINCAEVKEDQPNYKSTLDFMFQEVEERDPNHIAVQFYRTFKQGAGKTLKSILITCATRLQHFNIPNVARITNTDTLDLKSIGDEKTALFCIIPTEDTTYNFLVAMLYTQLFQTLYFHAATECPGLRLPCHVRFMLDEFANTGRIPDYEQKLSTMRKFEISCTIIIQNLAQLKNMYKDSWESITGNCDSFIFLGGSEQSTLEYVSKMLGKETIETQTDTRNFGNRGGSSRNKQIIGRELLTSSEIGEMDNKNCIVRIRGLSPFFTKKYDYTNHKNYKLTGDAEDSLLYNVHEEINLNRAYSLTERIKLKNFKFNRAMNDIKRREHKKERKANRKANISEERRVGARQKGNIGKPEIVSEETLLQMTGANNVEEATQRLAYEYSPVDVEDTFYAPDNMQEGFMFDMDEEEENEDVEITFSVDHVNEDTETN